ncbi:MAG: DUF4231 domain-containing protein [Chloroflexi bacterium]|nr:DUF4231 domain-containing protein [Chloroflexota bacterium]
MTADAGMVSVAPDTSRRESADQAYVREMRERLDAIIQDLELEQLPSCLLKDRWLDQLIWMENRANRNRDWFYFWKLIAIIGGILIPVAVTIGQGIVMPWMSWVAAVLGVIVAAAVAVEGFFQYGERWRHYRVSSEMLKREWWDFVLLTGDAYSQAGSHADAIRTFARRVESIIERDIRLYMSTIATERDQAEKAGSRTAPYDIMPPAATSAAEADAAK